MEEVMKAAKLEQQQAAPEIPKKESARTLKDRLYRQIEIMEREQATIDAGMGVGGHQRARSENLAFAKQITETANAIINIKRGGK